MTGCGCGWPLDTCNSEYTNSQCGKAVHEAEMDTAYRESNWGKAEAAIEAGDLPTAVTTLLEICKAQQQLLQIINPSVSSLFVKLRKKDLEKR